MPGHIDVDKKRIAEFCRANHIVKLALFGSVLRDDFGPDSDVDILVEFKPNHVPGLLGMARLERKLTEILGQKADLRTAEDLSRYFRDDVVSHAEIQYTA